MSGVINPGYRKRDSLMDIVGRAVGVARDLYGIKVNSEQLAAKEQELADVADEKARLAAGRLNKGELLNLAGAHGLVPAKKGDPGAFEYTDEHTGAVGYVAKRNAPKIRGPQVVGAGGSIVDVDPATGEVVETYRNPGVRVPGGGGGKTRGGGGGGIKPPPTRKINGRDSMWDAEEGAWVPIEASAAAPATYAQKVAGLKTEESRKRFDSSSMGLGAVDDMRAALDKGDNTFSLVGDNRFTLAAKNFEEALGRMQSGGAINREEANRFRGMAPKWNDSAEMQQIKLDKLEAEMALRLKTLGFEPGEVRAARADVVPGEGNTTTSGTLNKTDIPDDGSVPPDEVMRREKARKAAAKSVGGAFGGGKQQPQSATPPGSIVEVGGKKYKVGADGDTLEEIR